MPSSMAVSLTRFTYLAQRSKRLEQTSACSLCHALRVRRGALRRGVRRHRERVVGAEARVSDWAAFVRYAEMEHKAQFFRALTPASGELCCEGTGDPR